MSNFEQRGRENTPHSDLSCPLVITRRQTFSRDSSVDSIFEDVSSRAHFLFSNLDEEKKGYLDTHMLEGVCETQMNESQLRDLIHQLDHDGDGKVSVEDFKQCLREIARRNSVIRASIQEPSLALIRQQSSNFSSSSSLTHSHHQGSDDGSSDSEGKTMSPSSHPGSIADYPLLPSQQKSRRRLLTRLSRLSSMDTQDGSSKLDPFALDECFEVLSCQDCILELHRLLRTENPTLSPLFERVLTDVFRVMCKARQTQKRMEEQIECERSQHKEDILRLSEELDQQVQLAEESARTRERQLAMSEFKAQLEAKSAKVEQLTERLRNVEETTQSSQLSTPVEITRIDQRRIDELQEEVTRLRHEKMRGEEMLTSTRAKLVEARTESTTMRQTLREKIQEVDNHVAAFVEVVKENSNLKRQISLLQGVNRELCDANDNLCAVLERNADVVERTSGIREATTASALLHSSFKQFLQQYQSHTDKLNGSGLRMAHLERTASIQSDATDFTAAEPLGPAFRSTPNEIFRRKSSVQRAQFGTMWQMEANTVTAGNSGDSFHEDSGLSSLRDAPEVESEVELESNIGSPYTHKRTDNSAEPMKNARRSTHRQASVAEVSACEQDPHAVSVTMHGAPVERRMVSQAGSTGQPKTYGPVASKAAPVDEKLRIFRVMLAGDSAVGKTSLLLRLCDNAFNGKTVSTIGIDMKMRRITVDGRSTVLQLWDTAGQERFRSISASFYRKADGILLVYDCTSEASFLNTREWLSTIQENAGKEVPVAIVANKIDLRERHEQLGSRCVSYEAGRKLAQEIGALFFETSAVTGANVNECATELTRLLCAQEDYNLRRPQLKFNATIKPRNNNCCNT